MNLPNFKAFLGGGSVIIDLLFGVLPIGCGGSLFVFVLLYGRCSSFRGSAYIRGMTEKSHHLSTPRN